MNISSNGHNINYNFATKKHWRKWAWNQAKKRLAVRPSDAVVLFLPGKECLDLPVAKSKKFRPENMFAVEWDKDTSLYLRKCGVNTINGDIGGVVSGWGEKPKVDVVMADLCCAMHRPALSLASALWRTRSIKESGQIVIVNLQRGRDSHGALLKTYLEDELNFNEGSKNSGDMFKTPYGPANSKHRGVMFFFQYILNIFDVMRDSGYGIFLQDVLYMDALGKQMQPEFFSYYNKEKRLYMDSVAMNIPFFVHNSDEGKPTIRRDVMAAKAIRTMRISKTKRRTV